MVDRSVADQSWRNTTQKTVHVQIRFCLPILSGMISYMTQNCLSTLEGSLEKKRKSYAVGREGALVPPNHTRKAWQTEAHVHHATTRVDACRVAGDS